MIDHFNRLSPAEAERLALLAEECGEVVQAIGKILRHGYGSRDPTSRKADGGPTNRQALETEIGDLLAACELLAEADLSPAAIADAEKQKRSRVQRYLHHQRATP